MEQDANPTFTPASRDDIRHMLVVAGTHGAEMAARGTAIYALEGIPHFVKQWHRGDLPDWLFREPVAKDMVDDCLFRIAKYAWMQWRYRRIPPRQEFPNPPVPDWITQYAEDSADELEGELAVFTELRETDAIQRDGSTGEPPERMEDVVRSLLFRSD